MSLNIQSIPYPEYTSIERDALTTAPKGFKIFNTDTSEFEMYDGSLWNSFGSEILSHRIESTSKNSYAEFGTSGTPGIEEYLSVKANSLIDSDSIQEWKSGDDAIKLELNIDGQLYAKNNIQINIPDSTSYFLKFYNHLGTLRGFYNYNGGNELFNVQSALITAKQLSISGTTFGVRVNGNTPTVGSFNVYSSEQLTQNFSYGDIIEYNAAFSPDSSSASDLIIDNLTSFKATYQGGDVGTGDGEMIVTRYVGLHLDVTNNNYTTSKYGIIVEGANSGFGTTIPNEMIEVVGNSIISGNSYIGDTSAYLSLQGSPEALTFTDSISGSIPLYALARLDIANNFVDKNTMAASTTSSTGFNLPDGDLPATGYTVGDLFVTSSSLYFVDVLGPQKIWTEGNLTDVAFTNVDNNFTISQTVNTGDAGTTFLRTVGGGDFEIHIDNVTAAWSRGLTVLNDATPYGGFYAYGTGSTNLSYLSIGKAYDDFGIRVYPDAATELTYDNSIKLATTSTGVLISNVLNISDLSTTLSKDGSNNLVLTDSITGSKTLAQLLDSAWEFTYVATNLYDMNAVREAGDSIRFIGNIANYSADVGYYYKNEDTDGRAIFRLVNDEQTFVIWKAGTTDASTPSEYRGHTRIVGDSKIFIGGGTDITFEVDGTIDTVSPMSKVLQIESDGTLASLVTSYETLVVSDNDIPNKKYVDSKVGGSTFTAVKDRFIVDSTILSDGYVTLTNTPQTSFEHVIVVINGLIMDEDVENDYTLIGTTITFYCSIELNDKIIVIYKF